HLSGAMGAGRTAPSDGFHCRRAVGRVWSFPFGRWKRSGLGRSGRYHPAPAGGGHHMGIHRDMTIDFGAYAETYQQHRRAQPVVLAELLRFGSVGPGSTVLEIGCGTGNYPTAIIAETGACGIGVDPSDLMLAQA